jgi:hypothetical protein
LKTTIPDAVNREVPPELTVASEVEAPEKVSREVKVVVGVRRLSRASRRNMLRRRVQRGGRGLAKRRRLLEVRENKLASFIWLHPFQGVE